MHGSGHDLQEEPPDAHVITLTNGIGRMKKRTKPQIVRYHSFSKVKEPEKFHHSLFMLFKPWRKEEDLLCGMDTYTESYHKVQDDIKKARTVLEKYSEEVHSAIEKYEQYGPPEHAWDDIAPHVKQERKDLQVEDAQQDPQHMAYPATS